MKLPVRLSNTTNERRLVQKHETPLRVKGAIVDVSSELDNGGYRLHLDEIPRILLLSASQAPNKTCSRFMTAIKCAEREISSKCPEILQE
ncbi:hypothetical protein TNCV_2242731 [Trichonephila clavipes]|nr:hypothetical protein TNCV_2242731 [Trichonephila clavipes]